MTSSSKKESTAMSCCCGFFNLPFVAITILLICSSFVGSAQSVSFRDSTVYDFGEIIQGRPVKHVFHFVNTGLDTIDIETVRTDCGCTDTDWTRTEIAPNATGSVTVIFDARNRGFFNRKVRVYFRQIKKATVLRINGMVL